VSAVAPTYAQPVRRQLNAAEHRFLRMESRALSLRGKRLSIRIVVVCAAIFGVLWLITRLTSEQPDELIALFWLTVGGATTLRIGCEGYVRCNARARQLRSAMQRNTADVY
jgi:hypothetical protein